MKQLLERPCQFFYTAKSTDFKCFHKHFRKRPDKRLRICKILCGNLLKIQRQNDIVLLQISFQRIKRCRLAILSAAVDDKIAASIHKLFFDLP